MPFKVHKSSNRISVVALSSIAIKKQMHIYSKVGNALPSVSQAIYQG